MCPKTFHLELSVSVQRTDTLFAFKEALNFLFQKANGESGCVLGWCRLRLKEDVAMTMTLYSTNYHFRRKSISLGFVTISV